MGGLAHGLVAVFGGMLFLSIYLMILSFRHGGEIDAMILGARRARTRSTSRS